MFGSIKNFLADESGEVALSYGFIALLVGCALVTALEAYGQTVGVLIDQIGQIISLAAKNL